MYSNLKNNNNKKLINFFNSKSRILKYSKIFMKIIALRNLKRRQIEIWTKIGFRYSEKKLTENGKKIMVSNYKNLNKNFILEIKKINVLAEYLQ